MEYVYAAMLIHKAGKTVDDATVTKVLEAAGVTVDASRVKALIAALDGVNIEEAIEKASIAPAVIAPVAAEAPAKAKEDKKVEEEEKPSAEEAAAGLGSLFG